MYRLLFVFLGLAGITLSHGGRGLARQRSERPDRLTATLPTLTDSLQKPSLVTIKVFATKIGQPLASAMTITSRITNRFKRYTLPNGRLEETYDQPDQLDIFVSAPGYVSVDRQLTIEVSPKGKTYEFDVVLDRPSYSVTVRGINKRTGQPIPGIRFTLTGAALSAPIVLTPDPIKGFVTINLPDNGTYQVSSTAPGFSDFSKTWAVEKDHSDVTFKLVPTPPAEAQPPLDTSVTLATAVVIGKPTIPAPETAAITVSPLKRPANALTSRTVVPVPVLPRPVVTPKQSADAVVPTHVVPTHVTPTHVAPTHVATTAAPTHVVPMAGPVAPTHDFGTIEKGKSVRLEKLYFDQSSPVLRPESRAELDQLYSLLTENPALRIEIRGHTDNQGDFDANVQLARERCQTVVAYLVGKGIANSRLKAVGRGPIDPMAPNNNEENRKKNRRVEFVVQ